jgi:hypothetical protein
VKLNPSATEEQIALLNSRVGGVVHPYVVSIYECFNGFSCDDFDAKSMMEIWPIERVSGSKDTFFKAGYMPFSDFFGSAEIFLQSFENPERPVIALFKGTKIASSTFEFWEKFLSGDFNITQGKQIAK